jgi:hypothetical protein
MGQSLKLQDCGGVWCTRNHHHNPEVSLMGQIVRLWGWMATHQVCRHD